MTTHTLPELADALEARAAYYHAWARDIRAMNGMSVDADYSDATARDLTAAARALREADEALAVFADWGRLEELHGSTIGHVDLDDDVTAIVTTGDLQIRIGTVGDLRRARRALTGGKP